VYLFSERVIQWLEVRENFPGVSIQALPVRKVLDSSLVLPLPWRLDRLGKQLLNSPGEKRKGSVGIQRDQGQLLFFPHGRRPVVIAAAGLSGVPR
jgi:hypothetical protein